MTVIRSLLLSTVVAAAAALFACNEPTRYDQANFSDDASIQKNAGNYWKRDNFWNGMPKTVTKVAITQFNVEYVVENVNSSGASAFSVLGVMEMAGSGHRQRQYAEDFKRDFPTTLYAGFVNALKAEGVETVPMSDIQKQPAFNDLKAGQTGATYSQAGRDLLGHADNSQQVKMQVYPVQGLPLVDDGWFNAGTNLNAEMKLVGDTGAQSGLRVRIRVALDDDGHAVLDKGAVINVSYDLEKQEWQKGNPQWVAKQRHTLVSSGAFRDDQPCVDAKEFKMFKGDIYTVNIPKFQESIMKMYPTFVRMAAKQLRS